MSQRKVGTVLSYLSIILGNTISLVYTPYMLRMMGQSEYGLYGTANSFISYLSVLSVGIGGAYIRFNAIARAKKDKEEEIRVNGMFITVFLILAVIVLVVGLLFIAFAGILVKETFTSDELLKLRIIMLILITNMMVTFVCNVFMMALQAYEQFICVRLVLLIAAIIQPIINVVALSIGGRAITITAISLAVSIISYLIFYAYAKKVIEFKASFKNFDLKMFKELFVFSGFLFLNSITDQITFSTDNIILSSIKGTSAVAIYSVGANFKNYFQSFSSTVSGVFGPQVNQIVAEHRSDFELDEIFQKVGRIQFFIVSLILIGYCTIGHSFVQLWAGRDYDNAFYIGLLLMIAVAIPAFQNVSIEIQKAKNLHKMRSIVYFFIAIANIILTIPLSIRWSGMGAAFATTFSMVLGYAVFMNIYNWRYVGLNIPAFWKSIISIVPGYMPTIIICVLINRLFVISSLWDVLLIAGCIVIIFAISIWFFSMNAYERNLFQKPFFKMKEKLMNRR